MRNLVFAAAIVLAAGSGVVDGQQGRGGGATAGGVRVPGGRGDAGVAVSPREALALAADWRWFCPFIANGERNVQHTPDHREIKAINLLNDTFLNTTQPSLRRLAILGLARTGGNITEMATLYPKLMLENEDPSVRSAAADAIGLSFDDMPRDEIYGVLVMPPWSQAAYTQPARYLLENRLKPEANPTVAATVLRSMARLPLDVNDAGLVEVILSGNLTGNVLRVAGAIGGLEILARRAPKRPFSLDTSRRLREIAEGSLMQIVIDKPSIEAARMTVAEATASLRRMALLTLHESNSDSETTLIAATYDADWQVRRLAAMYLPARDDRTASELERLMADEVFQVRSAALTSLAPRMRVTLTCGTLMSALDDTSPAVVMTAIDVAPANCSEHELLLAWLRQRASALGGNELGWHVPSRALLALVRYKEPTARSVNARLAATHSAWEVRQLAASLTDILKDEPTAQLLAEDRNPNVRAAALRALSALESDRLARLALLSLSMAGSMSNGRSLLAAAAALPDKTPAEEVRVALDHAIRLASSRGSREVTLSLIAKYRKFEVRDSQALRDLLRDEDPLVARAAAAALTDFTGMRVVAEPRLRPPSQQGFQLRNLPQSATLELSNGSVIRIEFLLDDAPVTVAQFVYRWSLSYRDAFIDVVPGVGLGSGGLRDSALDGWSPPIRDELGEQRHTRGAVAMMSNGYDLGNGQIFIDLIDRPDLDHGYTVFARVVGGLDVADKILQGVEINRVRFSSPVRRQ